MVMGKDEANEGRRAGSHPADRPSGTQGITRQEFLRRLAQHAAWIAPVVLSLPARKARASFPTEPAPP